MRAGIERDWQDGSVRLLLNGGWFKTLTDQIGAVLLRRTPCKQFGGYEHSFVTCRSRPCTCFVHAAFIHSFDVYALLAGIFVAWKA